MSIGWAIVLFPIACAVAVPIGLLTFGMFMALLDYWTGRISKK